MKKLLLIFLCLIGCATTNKVWYKQGSSQQDFYQERAQCNAQAIAANNIYQIAIIQNQCLQGKGWYLVDQ
jgi:hypothetical protein